MITDYRAGQIAGIKDFNLNCYPRFYCSNWGFGAEKEGVKEFINSYSEQIMVLPERIEYARGYINGYQKRLDEERLVKIVEQAFIKVK